MSLSVINKLFRPLFLLIQAARFSTLFSRDFGASAKSSGFSDSYKKAFRFLFLFVLAVVHKYSFLFKVILATSLLYVAGEFMATAVESKCIGWECEEVYCPDGYAVRLPTGEYLPCEVFEEFILNQNKELLR